MDNNTPSNYNPTLGMAATGTTRDSPADMMFFKSLKGILRLCEVILSLLGIITSSLSGRSGAASYCMFVSIFTFIIFIITYFLWLFRVLPKLSPGVPITFIEFVILVIFCGYYFSGAIVAACFASSNGAMISTSVFYFVMTAICAVDTFFHHRYWMVSAEGPEICGKKLGGGDMAPRANSTSEHPPPPYSVAMETYGGAGPPPEFSPPAPDSAPKY